MQQIDYKEHAKIWLKLKLKNSFRYTDIEKFSQYLLHKKIGSNYPPELIKEIKKSGVIGITINKAN